MSRKRRLSESHQDSQEMKQRQRMTTYQQNAIFRRCSLRLIATHPSRSSGLETTQQKLYDGSKTFFRKLKDSTVNHGKTMIHQEYSSINIAYLNLDTRAPQLASCCSSMHCTIPIVANCDYCERHYCLNHLVQCSRCVKTFCPFCSTNV